MAEMERVTISLSKGFTDMLRAEYPHQTVSATIALLCEMAIDAELVKPRSKFKKEIPTPPLPPIPVTEESFGEV